MHRMRNPGGKTSLLNGQSSARRFAHPRRQRPTGQQHWAPAFVTARASKPSECPVLLGADLGARRDYDDIEDTGTGDEMLRREMQERLDANQLSSSCSHTAP